jgi:hypothetical protein
MKAKPLGRGIMLGLAAGVAMAVGVTIGVTASYPESSNAQTVSKLNIIYIVTHDMRYENLNARYMPKTGSLLANRGMTFRKAFVSEDERNPIA